VPPPVSGLASGRSTTPKPPTPSVSERAPETRTRSNAYPPEATKATDAGSSPTWARARSTRRRSPVVATMSAAPGADEEIVVSSAPAPMRVTARSTTSGAVKTYSPGERVICDPEPTVSRAAASSGPLETVMTTGCGSEGSTVPSGSARKVSAIAS